MPRAARLPGDPEAFVSLRVSTTKTCCSGRGSPEPTPTVAIPPS